MSDKSKDDGRDYAADSAHSVNLFKGLNRNPAARAEVMKKLDKSVKAEVVKQVTPKKPE